MRSFDGETTYSAWPPSRVHPCPAQAVVTVWPVSRRPEGHSTTSPANSLPRIMGKRGPVASEALQTVASSDEITVVARTRTNVSSGPGTGFATAFR
jgi:hypothetical protein